MTGGNRHQKTITIITIINMKTININITIKITIMFHNIIAIITRMKVPPAGIEPASLV